MSLIFKKIWQILTLRSSNVKLEKEYNKILNQTAYRFYLVNFALVTTTLIIMSILNFRTQMFVSGAILAAIACILFIIFLFRNKCKKIIPTLTFILSQVVVNWGSYFVYRLLPHATISNTTLFYFGYAFALLYATLSQDFPKIEIKFLFIAGGIVGRYILITPDSINTALVVTIIDISFILILWLNEKTTKNVFKSFYEYREELSKFQTLLAYHLPENIVIISKDLTKTFFSNDSFTSNFRAKSIEEIHDVLTGLRIDMNTFSSPHNLDFSSLSNNLSISTPTLMDFLTYIKSSNVEAQRIMYFNTHAIIENKSVCEDEENTNTYSNGLMTYSAKIFQMSWDKSDALVVMLHDLTQQETIIALKLADQNKDKVLATVSHELRTPINGMLGIAQIMEAEYKDPKLLSYVRTAKICSKLLLNLVNSILDLTQIRNNCIKLTSTSFRVQDLLDEVEYMFRPQCSLKGIDFAIDLDKNLPEFIITDRNRLIQIVVNLLVNAYKFTFRGGITVKVNSILAGEDIEFIIKDTGKGIKKEQQNKLLKMLGRPKNKTSGTISTNGVGLGLAIANSLVALLNPQDKDARIEMNSVYGQGTTFLFRVSSRLEDVASSGKLKPPTELTTQPIESHKGVDIIIQDEVIVDHDLQKFTICSENSELLGAAPLRISLDPKLMRSITTLNTPAGFSKIEKPSFLIDMDELEQNKHLMETIKKNHNNNGAPVLVVDDNAFNIMVVSNLLKKNGFLVTSAFNGEDAIEKVKHQDKEFFFKIVFMDCQMPIMDGFQATIVLVDMIRRKEIPQVPIVALTANNTKQDQEKCKLAGMSDFLAKPLKDEELQKIIKKFIPK